MHEVSMTVNGRAQKIDVESRMTLADALREECGLTGTHLACEHGVCGACTVTIDGKAVRSCLMFAVQADGTEVVTVEGLASGDELNQVQKAFQAEHGLQCGRPLRRGDPRGHLGQPVPLHRLPGNRPRREERRSRDALDPVSSGQPELDIQPNRTTQGRVT
jgi:predicted molibdopterin-dependent oxidoreductase YjgC